ncbi:MFS transporter [Conexibacter sp. S30A1]|uniref:MFS transporter n=1 Tax=Conexibacter sp. S30A1 TaxID=2937800 RepID=UPI00200F57DB|nr:MFS transporter [Conexibacter sp. S30A1]
MVATGGSGRESRRWLATYRSVLAIRDVRLLFTGLAVSATGSWAYNAALLALVYTRTHSLAWVGAAGLVRFLPSLLLSPYSGVVVERSDRFRLLLFTNSLSFVWQGLLAVVVLAHGPILLVLALAALTSSTGTFTMPAVGATVPSMVPESELVAANALQSTIDNLVVIIGPALGALLLAFSSAAVVFFVNAATFAVAALLVTRISFRGTKVDVTEGGTAGVLAQMLVGVRAILGARSARALVAMCALVSFIYGTDTVLFIGVSAHKLGTGADGFGYLLAGLGVGGVLMASTVNRLAARASLAWVIFAGVAGYTLPTALMVVIHSPALAFAVEVVRGGSTLVVDVIAITALQRAVPRDQLGRVMGSFWAFIIAAIGLGTVITPAITTSFGLDAGLWTMALAPSLVALAALPAMRRVDRDTAAASALLAPKVALLEQLGIFAAASRTLLERLAADAAERSFEAGAPIINQGEHADYLYVLMEGSVEVSLNGEAGAPAKPVGRCRRPTTSVRSASSGTSLAPPTWLPARAVAVL